MKQLFFLIILVITLMYIPVLGAQEQSEPIYKKFSSHLKKPYFTVKALLQVVGDYQKERTFSGYNGFNVSNARFLFLGDLDKNIGYFFQFNFISSPSILDAKMYFRFKESLQMHAGLFKAPFSKEYLTGAGDIDFVNRSQIVSAFAPKRQIGVMFNGWFWSKSIYY